MKIDNKVLEQIKNQKMNKWQRGKINKIIEYIKGVKETDRCAVLYSQETERLEFSLKGRWTQLYFKLDKKDFINKRLNEAIARIKRLEATA